MANVNQDYSQLKSVPNLLSNSGYWTTTTNAGINVATGQNGMNAINSTIHSITSRLTLAKPCPKEAIPVIKYIYPFRESIVFKHNMKYYFKKVELQNDGSMKLMEDYEDLQVAGNPSGLQIEGLIPEQFIVATMDYLETINPEADTEHQEAMKHLKYALAYLEKSNMKKANQTALQNKK